MASPSWSGAAFGLKKNERNERQRTLAKRIKLLMEFHTVLSAWSNNDLQGDGYVTARSFLNRNLMAVRQAVKDAGTSFKGDDFTTTSNRWPNYDRGSAR